MNLAWRTGALALVLAALAAGGCGPAASTISGEVKVDGKTVCNADITFRVVDFPKGEFLASMQEVARRIAFPMETVANG